MKEAEPILINGHKHILFENEMVTGSEMIARSGDFYNWMDKRRSVREFSDQAVPKEVIRNIIMTASTAPSGAHKQPWVFCAVSNMEMKYKIREAAEKEERISYEKRMSTRWKKDLEPLGTNMNKPFLEIAPWLIVAFKKVVDHDEKGIKYNNYYVNESIGIACGMLISAIHNAGLVTLTHTPSPMNFLAKLLDRPSSERAFLLLPIGYPKMPAFVPDLKRKNFDEVSKFYE